MAKHGIALDSLIREKNLKVIAEIGIEYGKLLKHLLKSPSSEVIEEYWAVDPWKPVGLKYGPKLGYRTGQEWFELYKTICECMRQFQQLRVLKMSSVEAASLFHEKYFDFVYIDGDHCYIAVMDDILAWLPKVKEGGIIGGHDYNIGNLRKAVVEVFGEDNIKNPEEDRKVWLKFL